MSELKKCEHCGGAVTLEVIDGRACIDDPTCERRHWEADAPCRYQGVDGLVEWWNSRVERTCVLEDIPYEPGRWEGVRCSSCGVTDEDTDLSGNYCPNCGARVVVE